MALQLSTAARNALLDAIETAVGAAPVLQLFSGSPPANCAAADAGTKLMEGTLPSNWLADAASAVKALAGTWSLAYVAAGTIGHFRIKQSATCHLQGTVTATSGGGDMEVSTTTVASGNVCSVTTFNVSAANA